MTAKGCHYQKQWEQWENVDFGRTKQNILGDLRKYSCLIKHEMHNERGFFKNEKCLDCQ